jgi:hypothetical protein
MNSILKCGWVEMFFREEQGILQPTQTWKGNMNVLFSRHETVIWVLATVLHIVQWNL